MEFLEGYLKYVLKEKKKEKKKKKNVFHTSKKKTHLLLFCFYKISFLCIFMASVSGSSGSCKKPVVA